MVASGPTYFQEVSMNTDPGCIFCKIVAGQIPATRVYEDDDILAFLDIGPLAEGHLLIIPKEHAERLEGVNPEVLAHLARKLPDFAAPVVKVNGAQRYNLLQNNARLSGQAEPHVGIAGRPRATLRGVPSNCGCR